MTDEISLDELAKTGKALVKEVKRDRYGRYLLPDPETGEIKPWTRASTMAKTLADTFGLEKWKQRNLAFGIGRRKDLYAKAASVASIEEKDTLNELVDEAFEAASTSSRANLGTALHRFTERIDAGEKFEVPEEWAPDIAAYTSTLTDFEISIAKDAIGQFSERIVICPAIDTAGTFDRLLQSSLWKLPRIGDLKTGSEATNYNEFALQLAIYANATHWWDPDKACYHKMPDIDLNTAVIMHLPVGAGACELYDVDIEAGWEAVEIALWVRNWRKRKGLYAKTPHPSTYVKAVEDASADAMTQALLAGDATKVAQLDKQETVSVPSVLSVDSDVQPAEAFEAEQPKPAEYMPDPEYKFEERLVWLRTRITAIIGAEQGQEMAELWGSMCPDISPFRKGGPANNAEVDRVAGVCALVEMTHTLPFHDGDPGKEKPLSKTVQELLV